jgi:hypothetical protein
LSSAHHYTIQAELISQLSRPRLPELGCSVGDPMVALSTYLENRPDLQDIATAMIAAANDLLAIDRAAPDSRVILDLESSPDSLADPVGVGVASACAEDSQNENRSHANSKKSKKADGQLTLL